MTEDGRETTTRFRTRREDAFARAVTCGVRNARATRPDERTCFRNGLSECLPSSRPKIACADGGGRLRHGSLSGRIHRFRFLFFGFRETFSRADNATFDVPERIVSRPVRAAAESRVGVVQNSCGRKPQTLRTVSHTHTRYRIQNGRPYINVRVIHIASAVVADVPNTT